MKNTNNSQAHGDTVMGTEQHDKYLELKRKLSSPFHTLELANTNWVEREKNRR